MHTLQPTVLIVVVSFSSLSSPKGHFTGAKLDHAHWTHFITSRSVCSCSILCRHLWGSFFIRPFLLGTAPCLRSSFFSSSVLVLHTMWLKADSLPGCNSLLVSERKATSSDNKQGGAHYSIKYYTNWSSKITQTLSQLESFTYGGHTRFTFLTSQQK